MQEEKQESFGLGQIIKNILIGIILGIANIIPGVSGGTMAVVTGVFDKLIAILTFDFKVIKKQWRFIVALVVGMAIAVFGFFWVIKYLLAHFPIATNLFFVGVVLGTCPFIFRKTFAGKGAYGSENHSLPIDAGIADWDDDCPGRTG